MSQAVPDPADLDPVGLDPVGLDPVGLDPVGLDPVGQLRATVRDCVHCGFCLPTCPTYQLDGTEMESPRGRIHLIGQLLDGGRASHEAAGHLENCLGCMACLTACPSGVRYDRLLGAARSWASAPASAPGPVPARTRRERAFRAAIFATFPYAGRLRLLAGPLRAAQWTGADQLARAAAPVRRLIPEAMATLRIAPRLTTAGPPATARARLPGLVPARRERRAVVGMLTGCVQRVFMPRINAATARVLAAEGCDVVIPPRQGCCGALSRHDGRTAEAADFARKLIAAFELTDAEAIVVNSAGCGSAMKEYGELLAGDRAWATRAERFASRVVDLSEFLAGLPPAAPRRPLDISAAYHDACHLAHAQRITAAPRDLLRAIPGVRLAEIADGGTCCGSAGIYNLVRPDAAAELGARKAGAVMATGASLLVSSNPGCSLQIAAALRDAGRPLPVVHLAQILDASINGVPLPGQAPP